MTRLRNDNRIPNTVSKSRTTWIYMWEKKNKFVALWYSYTIFTLHVSRTVNDKMVKEKGKPNAPEADIEWTFIWIMQLIKIPRIRSILYRNVQSAVKWISYKINNMNKNTYTIYVSIAKGRKWTEGAIVKMDFQKKCKMVWNHQHSAFCPWL